MGTSKLVRNSREFAITVLVFVLTLIFSYHFEGILPGNRNYFAISMNSYYRVRSIRALLYVYGAIINFPIIWVQLSVLVFPSRHKLGPHMIYLCGWFRKILLKLRKII